MRYYQRQQKEHSNWSVTLEANIFKDKSFRWSVMRFRDSCCEQLLHRQSVVVAIGAN